MAQQTKALTAQQNLEVRELIERILLHKGRGGIFIIAVEDQRTRKVVEQLLKSSLKDFRWYPLDASEDTDILLKIWSLIKQNSLDQTQTLFSVSTDNLSQDNWRKFLIAINFRREYIPEGCILFLMWIFPKQVKEIIQYAKDFWSFRTAFYRFQVKPFYRRGQVKLKEARTQIKEIEQLIQRIKEEGKLNEPVLAYHYFRLGYMAYKISDLNLSLKSYQEAERLYRKFQDERSLSATLNNIGNIYRIKGKLDKALKYYQEALKIDREIRNLEGVATALGNIGNVYQTKGDLDEALKYLKEALKLSREIGNLEEVAITLGNIGNVYQTKGELDEALKYHEEALRIKKAGHL